MTLLARLVPRLTRFVPARAPVPPARPRRSARAALAFGGLTFAVASVALAVAAETNRPHWRDPEYGHRLKHARVWHAQRPQRPLVLVFGSSRVQYGLAPGAMGFADEPGSPVVFNFGYRAAVSPGVWLQFARALDDGLKPRAVVVQVSSTELRSHGPLELLRPNWGPRLSPADLRRLEPLTNDPEVFPRERRTARRHPWAARRAALVSAYLPEWQPTPVRVAHWSWEAMDRHGYSPLHPDHVGDEFRRAARESMPTHRAIINGEVVDEIAERTLRLIVERCRAEGIAVAVAWAPESPAYRALYDSAGLTARGGFERWVAEDLGVPMFSAPEHLEEDHFADGYHLFPDGASQYSRWLADTHLKPWLARGR